MSGNETRTAVRQAYRRFYAENAPRRLCLRAGPKYGTMQIITEEMAADVQERLVQMNRKELEKLIKGIEAPDAQAVTEAQKRQASLVKPPGSLGQLEAISVKLAGVTGKVKNSADKQAIIIMSADNGVCAEGIASAPQSVTKAQTINFMRRLTGVGALARYFGVDLLVTDVGVKDDIADSFCTGDPLTALETGKIWNRKIRKGTDNIAKQDAMTEEEALSAVKIGIEAVNAVKDDGYKIFGVGEMGIGNTTTSAAVLSALTGAPAELTVGRGGGLLEKAFQKKLKVVEKACARSGFELRQDAEADGADTPDVIEVLYRVGGFDIAAMTGAYLGAAIYRIPVVIDGYISAVAALAAARLFEQLKSKKQQFSLTDFMFASHKSLEKGFETAASALGLEPVLLLGMRLGEGSGCPIAFKVVEAACAAMTGMATFAEADINDSYLKDIRKGDGF